MSEMIERVAKAKWARRQEVARKAGIEPPLADWNDETEALRNEVRAETRAGFEAMRELTDEMIDYGWEQLNWGPRAGYDDKHAWPKVAWQTMIDAALGKVDA